MRINCCQSSSREDADEQEACCKDEEDAIEAVHAGVYCSRWWLEGDARDMPVHPDAEQAGFACLQWDGTLIPALEEAEILTLRAEDADPHGCCLGIPNREDGKAG